VNRVKSKEPGDDHAPPQRARHPQQHAKQQHRGHSMHHYVRNVMGPAIESEELNVQHV
jgi:hypothetical protein